MNMHVQLPRSEKQDRLLDAADYIEKIHPESFDMNLWACCAASHIARRLGKPRDDETAADIAGAYLMLSGYERAKLFMPIAEEFGYGLFEKPHPRTHVSPEWAARTIRYLAFTGEIDWLFCKPGAPELAAAPRRALMEASDAIRLDRLVQP